MTSWWGRTMSPPDGAGAPGIRKIISESPDVKREHGLDLVCASEIIARPVEWLWPRRIALGKETMVAGHPGRGKSQLVLSIAGIVTTGGPFPAGSGNAVRGSVIVMSAEDDPEDTIRPRLEAAKADLKRCHIISAVHDGDRRRGFSLVADLARLDIVLEQIGDVRLVIVDPITAYLGETDSYRTAEVRAVLAPLADVAAKHRAAVVGVSHLRKSGQGEALLQVTDSLAFVAAPRAAYVVAGDPEDEGRRLFLPIKNNLGDDRTGFAYRIKPVTLPGGIETSTIVWESDIVTITANEALGAHGDDRRRSKRSDAAEWLRGLLAAGPVAQTEAEALAAAAGHAWATVRRAAQDIGIISSKNGFTGGWQWSLDDSLAPEAEIEL
jgi:putative DNA primase/helicase